MGLQTLGPTSLILFGIESQTSHRFSKAFCQLIYSLLQKSLRAHLLFMFVSFQATIHDQILWVLHRSGIEDLLLFIASSSEETLYCFHVLEIISLMFREQDPKHLASADFQRSKEEKQRCRPCPFIQILSRFYPEFYPDFIQILKKSLYPNFVQIFIQILF